MAKAVPVRVRPSAPYSSQRILNVLENYLPVLVLMAISVGLAVVLIGLGVLVSPRNPNPEKLSHMNVALNLLKAVGSNLMFVFI